MKTGSIHYSKLEKSPRLRRLLAYLIECGESGATTREINTDASIMAVSTAVAELRLNGFVIDCHFQGRTIQGSSVFRYVLAPLDSDTEKKFAQSAPSNSINFPVIKSSANSSKVM
jgi:hypothetical protein